jgi:hypothetical protein
MNCSICNASHEQTALFRVNAEEWRCRVHAPTDKWFDADPEIEEEEEIEEE